MMITLVIYRVKKKKCFTLSNTTNQLNEFKGDQHYLKINPKTNRKPVSLPPLQAEPGLGTGVM